MKLKNQRKDNHKHRKLSEGQRTLAKQRIETINQWKKQGAFGIILESYDRQWVQ